MLVFKKIVTSKPFLITTSIVTVFGTGLKIANAATPDNEDGNLITFLNDGGYAFAIGGAAALTLGLACCALDFIAAFFRRRGYDDMDVGDDTENNGDDIDLSYNDDIEKGNDQRLSEIGDLLFLAQSFQKNADDSTELVAQINKFTDRIKGYTTSVNFTATPSSYTVTTSPEMTSTVLGLGGGLFDIHMAGFDKHGVIYGANTAKQPNPSSSSTTDVSDTDSVVLGTADKLSSLLSTLDSNPNLMSIAGLNDAVERLKSKLAGLGGKFTDILKQANNSSSKAETPSLSPSTFASTMSSLTSLTVSAAPPVMMDEAKDLEGRENNVVVASQSVAGEAEATRVDSADSKSWKSANKPNVSHSFVAKVPTATSIQVPRGSFSDGLSANPVPLLGLVNKKDQGNNDGSLLDNII